MQLVHSNRIIHESPSSSEPAKSSTPPRKRRRPALSCEQCRNRKIKCDREYPCGQCQQSKTATCSYSPDSVPPASSHVDKYQSSLPPGLTDRSRDFETFPLHSEHISRLPGVVCSERRAPGVSQYSHTESETRSQQGLLDRIQNLEKKLASTNRDSMRHPKEKEVVKTGFEQKELNGTVSKTRFFGSSHWMHSFGLFEQIVCFEFDTVTNTPGLANNTDTVSLAGIINECKSLARKAKAAPHKQWLTNPNFRETVPPREICDQLVALYFKTCESTSRILHTPSFFKEYADYWANPAETCTVSVLKILMVMSIGACCYQSSDSAHWRQQALQWIFSAQSFLSSPFEKARLHISGLQVTCLVLIARLDNAVAGDLVWISAGSLLRTAFQMGFHRDPKYLPNMKPFHGELRRRLWATILELNIQSALDSGMPPLISPDDYDTEPPSNLNDTDISEDTKIMPLPKADHIFTDSSLQRALHKSISLRMEVIRQANNFHFEPSYEEVLQLSTELSTHCKENNLFVGSINSLSPSEPKISQLHHNLLDLWVRRFLLSLHRPFAVKGLTDPRYYFSRKSVLDYALTMLNYPTSNPASPQSLAPGQQDDYTRLTTVSGGFYKGMVVHSALVLFAELVTQLKEDSFQGAAAREPLKQTLRNVVKLSEDRVRLMDNNIKGHLFISIVIAQIEATESGTSPEKAVLEAGKRSAERCLELLKQRIPVDGGGGVGTLDAMFTPGTTGTGVTPDWGENFMMQDWINAFNAPDSWAVGSWQDIQTW